MTKRKNLSEQLNEYNKDSENLCGTNFAIHKMLWFGAEQSYSYLIFLQ